jgi:hypothetical protein
MAVKITLEIVYCTGDDYPGYVVVEITRELLNKMIKIGKFVKKNDLTYAKGSYPFVNTPFKYYDKDEDDIISNQESDIKIEAEAIVMTNSYFYISSISNHDIQSDTLAYDYVEELLNIEELPLEHMPKYINDEDENIRNIARKRLENSE